MNGWNKFKKLTSHVDPPIGFIVPVDDKFTIKNENGDLFTLYSPTEFYLDEAKEYLQSKIGNNWIFTTGVEEDVNGFEVQIRKV